MGMEARNYSWPPAWPGNDLAVVHGAFSPKIVGPEAEAEFERLVAVIEADDISYLRRPSFVFALENLAQALGQVRVIRRHLATEHGPEGSCERESCFRSATVLENRVDRRLAALGLDAASRSRIERDLSAGARDRSLIDADLAEGRRLRLAAEARDAAEQASDDQPSPVAAEERS